MQFDAQDIFVCAVDGDDEGARREVLEKGGFRGLAGVIARGADHQPVDFAFAPLRGGVEWSNGFDLVAKEVDAHRHLGIEWVDVEDAAAQGVFAGLFAERFVVVTEIDGEALGEGP